ncbi:MAG: pectate lyase [Planctomycetota bacterium]|nr:pectate lyase [Planctomycetota bacterium]
MRIANNVLLYQADIGGWYKNDGSIHPSGNAATELLSDVEKRRFKEALVQRKYPCTLDNNATHSEMRYLAKVYAATGRRKYKDGFLKGVHYLLKAQYPSGGWPQFYPLRPGYSSRITFNDAAMIGALGVLDDVANRQQPYGLADEVLRVRCKDAARKGLQCILKCQIVVNGKKTAWCQQHDEITLKAAQGRVSENPSISGAESVGVVRYLMTIDRPSAEVIDAVKSAVDWFDEVKITGVRVITVKDDAVPGGKDRRVVNDSKAGPIWARYYEIGTNRPMYIEQGVAKYSLAELSHKHRMGHGWIGGRWPEKLLEVEYPAWRARMTQE